MAAEWPDADRRDAALLWAACDAHSANVTLTPAERRCILGMSHGLGRQGVADAWGIDVESVKSQLRTARAKLAAKDTTHAVALALRYGIIR